MEKREHEDEAHKTAKKARADDPFVAAAPPAAAAATPAAASGKSEKEEKEKEIDPFGGLKLASHVTARPSIVPHFDLTFFLINYMSQ